WAPDRRGANRPATDATARHRAGVRETQGARPRSADAVEIPSLSRAPDAVLDDGVDGAHAVLPTDLLPFFVGAAAVADRHLVDAESHLGDLGGQLGLDAEAVLLDDQ